MKNRKIMITGAGSGFGLHTTKQLLKRGHTVIASTETEEQAHELRSQFANEEKLTVLKLDITDKADREKINEYRPEVLINNAAIGESGSLAEVPMDRVRHNFEVNVFSTFALSQLALKHMLAGDKGTVIFISSLAGRIAMPFLGPYSMTKFAVSAGADALRQEIREISKNVHISLIEPGAYHTGFNQLNVSKKFEWMDKDSHFSEVIDKIYKRELKQFKLLESDDTSSIVKKIVKAAEAKKPKLRYSSPWWQALGVRVLRVFGK